LMTSEQQLEAISWLVERLETSCWDTGLPNKLQQVTRDA
jgi:hypothetical protein